MSDLKTTTLNSTHRRMGAKMVDFGGYEMPVSYGSQIEEHQAVRTHCGLFDVSHMGVVDAVGADAEKNRLAKAQQTAVPPDEGQAGGKQRVGEKDREFGELPFCGQRRQNEQHREGQQADPVFAAQTRQAGPTRHLRAPVSFAPPDRAGKGG